MQDVGKSKAVVAAERINARVAGVKVCCVVWAQACCAERCCPVERHTGGVTHT
jgi:hypothetical protein